MNKGDDVVQDRGGGLACIVLARVPQRGGHCRGNGEMRGQRNKGTASVVSCFNDPRICMGELWFSLDPENHVNPF